MTDIPNAATFTTAPLRRRLRVDVTRGRDARVCYFRPREEAADGIVLRERIRWEAPDAGYATSADPANPFDLTNDLSLVTVVATPRGATFTWEQYYDHPDLPMMRADFDQGFEDIGRRLVARLGGRVVERYVDGPPVSPA